MKSKPLRLPDPVVIGMAVMHHGQRFVLCRTQPYVTLGGARSLVLHWRSHCATCGQPFEMTTGAVVWNLNRRCAMHHAPGRSVAGRSLVIRGGTLPRRCGAVR